MLVTSEEAERELDQEDASRILQCFNSQAGCWTQRCLLSCFLDIFIWLKYFVNKQDFCYCRLIHLNFGIFSCDFTSSYFPSLVYSLLHCIVHPSSSVFPFLHKLVFCNVLLLVFLPAYFPPFSLYQSSRMTALIVSVTGPKSSVALVIYRILFPLLAWNSGAWVVWLPPCISIFPMILRCHSVRTSPAFPSW